MMKRFCFVLVLLLVQSFAAMDSLSVPIVTSGNQSPTGIWWPKSVTKMKKSQKLKYANAAKSSAVVWFHGGMGSGNCQKGLVAGADLAELHPEKIILSVSACRENHWVTATMMNVVDAALDSVAARRGTPVDEISLVGISDGALGVLVYSVQGKRQVKDRLLMSSFGKMLGEARDIAGVNSGRMRTGRWRFLQGGRDRLYPSDQTVPWITEFCKEVQVDCELRFDPEGEHDWSYWKGRRMEWIREAVK